jgi:hypothetical protein
MANALVDRVAVLGQEHAPHSFAVAMSTELHRCDQAADGALFGELLTMLMRYFAFLFSAEISPSLRALFIY